MLLTRSGSPMRPAYQSTSSNQQLVTVWDQLTVNTISITLQNCLRKVLQSKIVPKHVLHNSHVLPLTSQMVSVTPMLRIRIPTPPMLEVEMTRAMYAIPNFQSQILVQSQFSKILLTTSQCSTTATMHLIWWKLHSKMVMESTSSNQGKVTVPGQLIMSLTLTLTSHWSAPLLWVPLNVH